MKEAIVVTRHPALVEFLREQGIIGEDVKVLTHASPEDVRGRVVFGVLPLWLAAEAEAVVEISLDIPPELRGKELSLEQVREFFRGVCRYKVLREPIGQA